MRTTSAAFLFRSLAVVTAALMFDCATLTPIPQGVCGNGVIDANEDCDSFPDACGLPNTGVRSCRLTCERGKAGACPVGWGCGVEGVCRKATGEFENASAPTSAGVVTVLTGDFDGDGRADVFGGGPKNGSAKPRVHFFDSTGTPAPPVALSFPMSSPVVRDFDGDGRDDLAYAFNADNRFGAVGLLAGTADRAFSPVLVPTYTRPSTAMRIAAVPFDPYTGFYTPNAQGALVTLERTSAGTFFRSISGTNITSIVELEQPAPFGPEQVVGPPAVGVLFSPTSMTPPSACGEVVFAYNDASNNGHLAVLSPCTVIGGNQPRWQPRPVKDFALPAKVIGGAFIGNIDGNYPEVFVPTAVGTLVAGSDGNTLGEVKKLAEADNQPVPVPLALADIDQDGKLDFVLPTGLYITGTPGVAAGPAPGDAGADSGTSATTSSVRPVTGRWADARIGNFNGDSLPDLVAVSPEALEIEFFANAGKSLFTRFSVPSNEPVRAITTGDFDGDRLQDIAFLASSRALGDEEIAGETDLLIAYGRTSGGPEPARVVGRFKEARALTTLHQFNRPIDEIVVLEATPGQGGLPSSALTDVFSSGDRQAIAPLVFRDNLATTQASPNQLRFWVAASLVAAPLVKPDTVDLMSVAFGITIKTNAKNEGVYDRPFPTGAWFAGGGPGGTIDPLKEIFRFDPKAVRAVDDVRFDSEGVVETLIVSATGDIDSPPDGISEVVTITRGLKADTSNLQIVRKGDLAAGKLPTQLALADVGVTGGEDELALLDVDADDHLDAVLITRGKNREKLRVYLNDGKGSFAPAPITLDLPKAGGLPESPVAFTSVITGATTLGKPQPELAVVSSRRLFLAKMNEARTGLDVRDLTDHLGLPLSGNLTSITAGDFDGDGVQDLAIADSGSIRLLRQLPRLR